MQNAKCEVQNVKCGGCLLRPLRMLLFYNNHFLYYIFVEFQEQSCLVAFFKNFNIGSGYQLNAGLIPCRIIQIYRCIAGCKIVNGTVYRHIDASAELFGDSAVNAGQILTDLVDGFGILGVDIKEQRDTVNYSSYIGGSTCSWTKKRI